MVSVDRFDVGLLDLTRRQQADPDAVLEVLRRKGGFSCFEASDNPKIAGTMTRLCRDRLTIDPNSQYPWSRITHIDGKPLKSARRQEAEDERTSQ